MKILIEYQYERSQFFALWRRSAWDVMVAGSFEGFASARERLINRIRDEQTVVIPANE